MRRRDFLALATALPAATIAGRLYAAPRSPARLLIVFLRGGYDCANLLVPYASDFYYESRPYIAVPRPRVELDSGALALDADWALAPAVRDSLGALYHRGEAAFVPFAGTDDLSRSHFETQDRLELGLAGGSARDYRTGFLARLAGLLAGAAPIAFTDSLPLAFRGAADVPNISLRTVSRGGFDERQAALLEQMYAGHRLEAAVVDGIALRQEVARDLREEMAAASRGAASPRGFELEAPRIARLLREEYALGFVDVGGWDTHVNEGGATGALATNLAGLGRGLQALADGLGETWRDTVVVVVSEFGRTFRENGNRGTDHGHGSVYWVLGGGLRGGRVAGEQLRVGPATLLQNRDFPVLNDYRALLGGLFRPLWGLSPSQLDTVFPGAASRDLGLV
jgi:uncharacterized protein (DUF1501 family)